jgi:hypothetical protein
VNDIDFEEDRDKILNQHKRIGSIDLDINLQSSEIDKSQSMFVQPRGFYA